MWWRICRKKRKRHICKKGKNVNDFFLVQQRYKMGIFSHNTALYFYHLTDRNHLDKRNVQCKMLITSIKETSKHREAFDIINDKNILEDVINSIQNDNS